MKKLLFTLGFFSHLLVGAPVQADTLNYRDMLDELNDSIAEESEDVEDGAEGIEFPSFEEEDEGADIVVAAIQRLLDFLKLVTTPLAVLFMTIMGMRMVTAGKENDEVMGKAKNYIAYALEGLIFIFVADSVVNVFFGAEGEIFRGGEAGAQEFARRGGTLFRGIYSLIQVIIAGVSVFMLVMAGMRYVASAGNDDQTSTAKKQITWSLVGLFVIGISEFVVKEVLFQNQGTKIGVAEAKMLFVQLTNFIAGTLGTLSFVFLLYAGYLYVLASQNEDNTSKAKKIIMGAFAGIILALAAFAITNTVVELDASR